MAISTATAVALLVTPAPPFLPAPHPVVQMRPLIRTTLPTTALLAGSASAPSDVSLLSTFFDEEAPTARADATTPAARAKAASSVEARAAALRAKTAEKERTQAARDEVAIKRMAEVAARKAAEAEENAARGIPKCSSDGVFGESAGRTGVLTAQQCMRDRDGIIESGTRTGAFLIF